MKLDKPGKLIDEAPYIAGIDFSAFQMRVPTARDHCAGLHTANASVCGCDVAVRRTLRRIPQAGDWMEHRLFDQS